MPTGQLGTATSQPGNIELGSGSSSPPPPPPPPLPTDPAVHLGPGHPLTLFGATRGNRPLYSLPPLTVSPPGQAAQVSSALQAFEPVMGRAAPVLGPWQPLPFLPVKVESRWNAVAAPPAVLPQIQPPPYSAATPVPGPWNRFGFFRAIDPAVGPNIAVIPLPPGVPPVAPPPSVAIGPGRKSVPVVPRAPNATDDRVRPHIDIVANILNSLLRAGYLVQTAPGTYAISGGGYAQPRKPVATDDASVGAVVGSTFVNTLDNSLYVCVNNSVGSAVWKQLVTM